ncbi:MAG: glycosyltransferase family 4 protein [bacterium]|nr:glycosyltransferase family 4 protein [bacterium]
MKRKRVAMVAYTIFRPDARVRRHVNALRRSGYHVDVYALLGPDGIPDRNEDGLTFYLPRKRVGRSAGKIGVLLDYALFTAACAGLLIWHHFRMGKYCLVHINNMPNFLIAAALPLRACGVPAILDIHDTMPEIYQDKFGVGPGNRVIRALYLEERLSMQMASYVLTTEHTKMERLQQNGLRSADACVVLNLPDSAVFPDRNLRGNAMADRSQFRLVYHGTLTRRLGMDLAIRAMALLRNSIPGLSLEIIGDGEQREELIALAHELDLESIVRFSDGFVPVEDLPDLLTGAHLAIIPSRKSVGTSLMLPTKLLEYVRIGIPAITVPTLTILRYFDESMVRFAESESPQSLADAITYLNANPGELERLATAAKEFYCRFSFERERDRYLEVVERLVTARRSIDPETGRQ